MAARSKTQPIADATISHLSAVMISRLLLTMINRMLDPADSLLDCKDKVSIAFGVLMESVADISGRRACALHVGQFFKLHDQRGGVEGAPFVTFAPAISRTSITSLTHRAAATQ